MGLLERKNKTGNTSVKPTRASYGAGNDEPQDPAQEARRRARRRLVGAIALVLAAVIVLPMVLDSEPTPLRDDIPILIPDRNGQVEAPKPPVAAVTPAPGQADAPPATPVPSTPVAPTPEPRQPETARTEPTRPEPRPEPVRPEPTRPERTERAETAKPERAEPAKPAANAARAEADRARALLEGQTVARATPAPEPKADAKPDGKSNFAVQIAAFSTEERAQDMRDRLSAAGIKASTERVKTGKGDVFRVRVGPFSSREAADVARNRVNAAGFSSSIVPL